MNTNNTNKSRVIFPELSYMITGICFDIHNSLGRFARERQYANALESNLKETKIHYKREFRVRDTGNILDFVVENKIALEIKAKKTIVKEDYYQIQRYLQILNVKLGLLINFRSRFLKQIRVVRIDTDARNKFINNSYN